MKSISLVTFLLSSILFTVSPQQIIAGFGVFGLVVSISVFIDAVLLEKKRKNNCKKIW
jgi:uncharacterized membrane protein